MKARFLVRTAVLATLFCCGALALLPARWLTAALPASWPLAVVDATGTVWDGVAVLAVGPPERRRTLPDAVRWRWVLSGGPKLKVAHPWLAGPLLVSPTWNGIGISGQSLRLPASALATLDARVEAIGPTGELSLKWPATFIGLTARSAGATLLDAQWHNAGAALAPIRPLGHYQLTLTQSASDGIEVHLDTTTGPLILSGKGVMSASGRFTFDGAAQSDPKAGSDTQVALHDLLAALGPTTNNLTTLRFR